MFELRTRVRSLAKSRIVHFMALGAVLFAFAPRERDGRTIVIETARVEEALRAEEARHGRALDPSEKLDAVRDAVDEEVLAREAIQLGLGLDDPVVRARLAERARATFARGLPQPRLDEAELTAAVAREIERAPDRVRLAVWFVAKERVDAAAEADRIASAIRSEGREHARGRGERSPLPDGAVWTEEALARAAGAVVARAAFETRIGEPSAALPSAWGFYVVVPLERRRAEAHEVRAEAVARLTRTKQAAEVARIVKRARHDYAVEVRSPAGEPRYDVEALPPPAREDVN